MGEQDVIEKNQQRYQEQTVTEKKKAKKRNHQKSVSNKYQQFFYIVQFNVLERKLAVVGSG